MTDDIKKKYEEAAKDHSERVGPRNNSVTRHMLKNSFLAGAAYAEKQYPTNVIQIILIEAEAYNRAIEDAIKLVNSMISNDHLISRSVVPELEKLKKL